MALEDILRAMEQQAQAEIARLKGGAEAEAGSIVAMAEEDAKRIKARHLANIMPRVQHERARMLSDARLAVLREVMAAREALLEEAFAAAKTELGRLREKSEYSRYLAWLTHEVVDELGHELCIVVDACDESLMRRIAADLGVRARIEHGLHTAGGLEASTADGCIRVVNTIEARLQRSQHFLRREIASILSAEDVSWKTPMATPMPASGQ